MSSVKTVVRVVRQVVWKCKIVYGLRNLIVLEELEIKDFYQINLSKFEK